MPKLIARRFVGKDSPVNSLLVDLVADIPNKLRRQSIKTKSLDVPATPTARKQIATTTINMAPNVIDEKREILRPRLEWIVNYKF